MECFDTMPQEIFAQLEKVRRRRGRRRAMVATCRALTALLLATFVLIGLDRVLGISDLLGRGLLTCMFAVSGVMIIRRWFVGMWHEMATPLQIAQEVEQLHPELQDLIANAYEFAQQANDDLTAGSESLRRVTVLRAAAAVDQVDWQQLTPRKPFRLAVLALVGMGITIGFLGWYLPQTLKIGATRLLNPFSLIEWPREHDLQFIAPPTLLAAGEDLVLQLHDTQGTLPESIAVHYRTRLQGRWNVETQIFVTAAQPLEIHRPNLQESLQYRATGGDHESMTWQALEVVAAPRIEQLQVTIHPPAYTRLSKKLWEKGAPIYMGSELELQGCFDQLVTEVVLQSKRGKRIACQISPDGHKFRVEYLAWRVESSDTFALQVTTASGLTTRVADRIVLEVVADKLPQVRFVEPISELSVVPDVSVPFVIEANDDLAVKKIELVYRRSDRPDLGAQRLLLWTSSNKENVRQQRVEFLWELAPLLLEQGCFLEVHAQALDSQPEAGQTLRTIRIQIVSKEELWHQILEQQARLVEKLSQLISKQRELHGITHDWSEFPRWSKSRWASASHSALFRQRQISDTLAGGQLSIVDQLASLTQTIELNRLLRPEAVDRLQATNEILQNLADDSLVTVERLLSEFTRLTKHSPMQENLRLTIAALSEKQNEVLAGLQSAVNLLMPGNVLGRMERELVSLETEQETLIEHCKNEIAPQLLLQENEPSSLKADLTNATRRQRELVHRLGQLVLDMTRAAQRVVEKNSLLAIRLTETVSLAEELGTQANLQKASDQLARRRLGRSVTLQQLALVDLAKLRNCLSGQDAKGAAQRLQQLQTVDLELHRLRRQVAALEQELRQRSPGDGEPLAKQSDSISKQLEQLGIPHAAKATHNAASQLRLASPNNEAVKQAQHQLDEAQRQVTAARRRQQVALARLEMAQLDAKLDVIISQQQAIQQEISQQDRMNFTEKSTLRWSLRQRVLREEVLAEAKLLTSLPVFAHLLSVAGETMQHLEDRLQRMEFDQPTVSLAKQAVRQLTQLAEVLRQEQNNLTTSRGNRNKTGQGGEAGDKPQEQTLQLALGQLRLLRTLQASLHEETQTYEEQRATAQPQTYSADDLARQQQQLTELTRQLIPDLTDQENEP